MNKKNRFRLRERKKKFKKFFEEHQHLLPRLHKGYLAHSGNDTQQQQQQKGDCI